MTDTPTTEVAVVDPAFSDAERYALAAFLAGYRCLTRGAYALDLRQFIAWCEEHNLRLFAVRRADIECFARDLEARGRARATVARRLCRVAGFYRYAEQEGLLERSSAAHVRRPRLDYESHATGLDRNDVGALLVAAELASARDHALISLLAINGLRVSEALGATSKPSASNAATAPSSCCARAARSSPSRSRRAPPELSTWPSANGSRGRSSSATTANVSTGRPSARIVRRLARRAGINKPVGPHTLRHAFITAALDAGVPLRDVQEAASHADPRTTMHYDRARVSLDRHATYVVAAFLAGAAP